MATKNLLEGNEEEVMETIRKMVGFDPVKEARKEKIKDIGLWVDRKIEKVLRESGEMSDNDIEALARVVHEALTKDR